MSPLAILYFLLASSPVYNNWRHESPMSSPSSWAFPSTFDSSLESSMMPFEKIFGEWTPESSFFGRNVESTHFNWLLRKALRTSTFPSTRRSLINEMTGLEVPSMFETESVLPIFKVVKMIERIARVNPILIEKLLTRPESRFALESVLRTVEPSSLRLVEKLIRKNVPFYLREKVARRVVKSLLTSSILSTPRHHMSRRSIVSELLSTKSILSTPFSTLFNVEEPMTLNKIMIEKVMRHAEVAKIVKKLIKKSIVSRRSIVNEMYPTNFFGLESTTPFSTLFNVEHEPMTLNKIVKKALRHAEVRRMIKKLIKKSLIHSHESVLPIELLSTLPLSHKNVERKMIAKIVKKALRHELPVEVVLSKVIRRLVKSNVFEHESLLSHAMPRHNVVKSIVKSLAKESLSTKNTVCRVCESVCMPESNIFSSEESPIFSTIKSTKKVCRACFEVCPTLFAGRFPSPVFGLEHFDF